MKNYTIIGAILLSSTLFIGCGSSDTSTSNTSTENKLIETNSFNKNETDIIYKHIRTMPQNVQVSIAKIVDGTVHYYGALNQNNSVVTIDNYTRGFVIASISKVFTSTLLAQTVLDGKIGLDDNIAQNLPFSLAGDISISYKQLANHTSGVERDPTVSSEERAALYNEFGQSDNSDLVRYLKEDMVLKHTQNTHHYSNVGVAILAYMLTQIENKPFNTLLQENIFNPLSMQNTTLVKGENLVPSLVTDTPNPPIYAGVGGIISTVEDLYKFALATFDDRPEYLLTQKPTFKIEDSLSIGLGWFILNDLASTPIFHHSGGTEGYRSTIYLNKESKDGMIILSNLPLTENNRNDINTLAEDLLSNMYN